MTIALRRFEEGLAGTALAAMVLLPLLEFVARTFFSGRVPGALPLVQHLTLWIAFLGAALAAREGKLLSFSTGKILPARFRSFASVFSSAVAAAVTVVLLRASIDLIAVERRAASVHSYLEGPENSLRVDLPALRIPFTVEPLCEPRSRQVKLDPVRINSPWRRDTRSSAI